MAHDLRGRAASSEVAARVYADGAGGNLADAVAGKYDFAVFDVLAEAWTRTRGLKLVVIAAGAVVFLAITIVTSALGFAAGLFTDAEQPGALTRVVTQLILMAVVYPFLVGFMMLGIRRAVDLPIGFGTPFSYLSYAVPVVGTAILLSLLTLAGFFLFVLPGIYLSVAYVFALPLVVEKGLRPWAALEASRTAVTAHWFKIFALFLLLALGIAAGAITLVGWIWTAPMWYAGFGIVYRIIFGVEDIRAATAT